MKINLKKNLFALSFGLAAFLMPLTTLIACGQPNNIDKKEDESKTTRSTKKYGSRQNLQNLVLTTDWKNVNLNKDLKAIENDTNIYARATGSNNYSNEYFSTLAKKIVDKSQNKLEYIPYVDIGIVENTIEYLLKEKGLPGRFAQEAIDSLAKFKTDSINPNINFNNIAEFKKENIASKFNIGFMQNAHDSLELEPAWNAVPNNDHNQSGKWFQEQRWDKWIDQGIDSKDLTITFGPFANSFWHTAYLNNFNEIDLAKEFKSLSAKYNTKSFDFYFASPYNSKSNLAYRGSTALLAGALKILIEQDPEFKIRLSVVTGRDGLNLGSKREPFGGNYKRIGDDVNPLYEFTKFLGVNFNLNLVVGYFHPENESLEFIKGNPNWEIPSIKEALENSHFAWKELINYYVGDDYDTPLVDDDKVYNNISITPWSGIRSEKAVWDFTAQDALELRKLAQEKKLHSISNFYISRDNPSVFVKGSNEKDSPISWSDKNPINQHLRSGKGYPAMTYSKIFNGSLQQAPEEITDADKIYQDLGALNYKDWILDNKELDKYHDDSSGNWDGGGSEEEIIKNNNSEKLGKHLTWHSANPLRSEHVLSKTASAESNNTTIFSPYIDVGLWPLSDYGDIKKHIKNLDHLTLAFVQQENVNDNEVDLTFAGYYKPQKSSNPINDDFVNSHLIPKILQPIKDSNKFKNLTISYGGFNTGDNEKNPWHTALRQKNGNVEEAAKLLAQKIKQFNVDLAALVGLSEQDMSYRVDFDIEGHARTRVKELSVLFKALTILKKQNSAWDFSLTLPVLPSGLITSEITMLDQLISEYKDAKLDKIEQLPIINIMAMDYGIGIYSQALKDKKTNFDLAKSAIQKTQSQVKNAIIKNLGISVSDAQVYQKIAVTPMIGVNDHPNGVFTLEDAKELYNFAKGEVNLAYISIWSLNCDNPTNKKGIYSSKTITTSGLNYLRQYDFVNTFLGNWDDGIKTPKKNPFGVEIDLNILK